MRDFEFGFDDNDFSDRILRIEIIPDDSSDYDVVDVKVKTLHISSLILAEKSPFFYMLFKNGMRESRQSHATLKINASEEAALMDLLKFTYSNTLSANTVPDLLGVLKVAERFGVVSCMKYCSDLLLEFPMSLESAPLYLQLPSSLLMAEEVKPLQVAAEQYLDGIYKLQEEAMALPLSDVEVVLRSDDLQVKIEDDVLDFMVKWAGSHYPNNEERREILSKRLVQFIRFPYLSCWKLKKVLVNPELNHEQVQKFVREALFFKAGLASGQCTNHRFIERAYHYRPIKVVQFEFPWPCCAVYFNLKKDECANLSLSNGHLFSQTFCLDGRYFYLLAECVQEQPSSFQHFGLFLYGQDAVNRLDYEFEVMKKPSKEFESMFKINNCTLTNNKSWGRRNIFGIPWSDFIAEDSEYFINDILHLRAMLTIKDSKA